VDVTALPLMRRIEPRTAPWIAAIDIVKLRYFMLFPVVLFLLVKKKKEKHLQFFGFKWAEDNWGFC
jgi:hypothetical protein